MWWEGVRGEPELQLRIACAYSSRVILINIIKEGPSGLANSKSVLSGVDISPSPPIPIERCHVNCMMSSMM